MSLRLGAVTTVVASSPDVAREFLQKHDAIFATRLVNDAMGDHARDSIPWLPHAPRWRSLRKMMATELFAPHRLDALQGLRSDKVRELAAYVARLASDGAEIDVGRVAFTTMLNLLSRTIFSRDLTSLDDHGGSKEFQVLMAEIMEYGGCPNVSDFFPALARADLQGLRRRLARMFARLHVVFDEEDLFIVGSDTSSITVEWAMVELLRNPSSMTKAHEELAQVIGSRKSIEESDIDQLPYLQAIVKETFRLHPPAPFLLPLQAQETIRIAGYMVPQGARVLVNVWAIGRDEGIWPKPDKFMPEWFIGREVDYKGGDFEVLPFSAGRRMCPGVPLATRMVHLVLATLLNWFKWRLPVEVERAGIDMTDKFGVTLTKAIPLCAITIPI
ncbi:hypothetical protein ACQ4PT_068607 [Festuca glaucescens]